MARLKIFILSLFFFSFFVIGCEKRPTVKGAIPKIETSSVPGDADECAFWIHQADSSKSVLIGNDKKSDGALYVWNMNGEKIFQTTPLNRPVGVDVRYSIKLGESLIDIVACGIRSTNEVKIFKIDPSSRKLIDITIETGISSGFQKSTYGLCLYKRPNDGQLYAFVSSQAQSNIHQIQLDDNGEGKIQGNLIRSFGKQDQISFVEGMIADDELGYLYCSDETFALLKYEADPEKNQNNLLLRFATKDNIRGDREGLGLYKTTDKTGYLVLSSQGNSQFKIYKREGNNDFVKTSKPKGVKDTDGIAVTSSAILSLFPYGAIACHNSKNANFVIYDWREFFDDSNETKSQPSPARH